MPSVYDFKVSTIEGQLQSLRDYEGQALLIVNVASRCGFTPQYAHLETLYRQFRDRSFVVLGFPCDQFGHQEPGDENEIQQFCKSIYDVTFPMYAKIAVNGPAAHPLYRHLKSARRGFLGTKAIKWNFTKFLIDQRGSVVQRYAPAVAIERIKPRVLQLLAEAPP